MIMNHLIQQEMIRLLLLLSLALSANSQSQYSDYSEWYDDEFGQFESTLDWSTWTKYTPAGKTLYDWSSYEWSDYYEWTNHDYYVEWTSLSSYEWTIGPAFENGWSIFDTYDGYEDATSATGSWAGLWSDWSAETDWAGLWSGLWSDWSEAGWWDWWDDWSEGDWGAEDYVTPTVVNETVQVYDALPYVLDDPDTNWCIGNWEPESIAAAAYEEFLPALQSFGVSGELSTWCIQPRTVLIVTDLRYVNLNLAESLPTIFGWSNCSGKKCRKDIEGKSPLQTNKLLSRIFQVVRLYRKMDCGNCLCKNKKLVRQIKDTLEIAKDSYKMNGIMGARTTDDTPPEVKEYVEEVLGKLGLQDRVVEEEMKEGLLRIITWDDAMYVAELYQHVLKIDEVFHMLHKLCG